MDSGKGGRTGARGELGALEEITAALGALIDVLERGGDLSVILDQVCGHVVRAVPDADHAAVTVVHPGNPEVVAGTAGFLLELERAQYAAGAGPGLDAVRGGRVIRGDVTRPDDRWPRFTAACARHEVVSFLAAPMPLDDQHSGAVSLYSTRRHGFAEVDAALLELFVTAVAAALRGVSRYLAARKLAEQLRDALETRAVIGQAIGILMVVRGLDERDAFQVLAERSQRHNVKLREVATDFVSTVRETTEGDRRGDCR